MARAPKPPPQPWFDPKTGNATEAFRRYILGERDNTDNVNSGVAQARAEAAAAQATATAASNTAQATQSNGFAVTVDRPVATVTISGGGLATTPTVTVTPSGGVAPYTHAWSKISGDTFNLSAPAAATTDFYQDLTPGSSLVATYEDLVTDSALAEARIQVAVSAIDITF